MLLSLEKKSIADVYETPIIQQTSFWSYVKRRQGQESLAIDYKARNSDLYLNVGGYSSTTADVLLFLRYLNDEDCIAYAPYGPELEPSEENQGIFLEELSESLRSFLPRKCIAIRYDLNWKSHWSKDSDFAPDGTWLGAPGRESQEIQLNYCTQNKNLRKSNEDILPSSTVLIDLTPPERDILARMKPKTRYNIGLALRKGVEIREGTANDLSAWYSLYLETADRNGLHVNGIRDFQSLFIAKKEDGTPKPVQVKLLIAEKEGMPLAAMFLLLSSHRSTYLYGASSSGMRNCMPTYALQWGAIQLAKKAGCLEYDMFGTAPNPDPSHPMYGLYKFKTGFGGNLFHQMGAWDYPLDPEKFSLFEASEMCAKGYYA